MILKTGCEKIRTINLMLDVLYAIKSTAGRSAFTDHANGRKHSEANKKYKTFLLLQRNQPIA